MGGISDIEDMVLFERRKHILIKEARICTNAVSGERPELQTE